MGVLLIRADGGAALGTGHVMRCLALAQAWQDAGGEVLFAVRSMPELIERRLAAEKMSVRHLQSGENEVRDTIELATEAGAEWVVLDGYQFGEAFARAIMEASLRLLVIDDFGGAVSLSADLVLNQNVQASEAIYKRRSPRTGLLLGSRYVLLRREFLQLGRKEKTRLSRVARLLVTLGGTDPSNATRVVIDAILQLKGQFDVVVIIGPGNLRADELERAAKLSCDRIELRKDPLDMPELMAWADLAVSAAGTTCWELAFMGVPMLLIVVAENQRPSAERLNELGAARSLGWHESLSTNKIAAGLTQLLDDGALRESMSQKAALLVDGQGAQRVVTEMRSRLLRLRRAGQEDSHLLLEWANEPTARAASFSSAQISPEEHQDWFARKLRDSACDLFIALDQQQRPVGQVRFDREKEGAVLSVSLDCEFRGHGTGAALIRLASREFLQDHPEGKINAYVKPENAASKRAFLKAGFVEAEPTLLGGQKALHFLFEANPNTR